MKVWKEAGGGGEVVAESEGQCIGWLDSFGILKPRASWLG